MIVIHDSFKVLANAIMIINYDCTVIMIIIYDRKTFYSVCHWLHNDLEFSSFIRVQEMYLTVHAWSMCVTIRQRLSPESKNAFKT